MVLVTFSQAAISMTVNDTLSARCHNDYLKISAIQSEQTNPKCIDSTYGGGFEFASGYLLQNDLFHAKEALEYQKQDLQNALNLNCKNLKLVKWGLLEINFITNIIG